LHLQKNIILMKNIFETNRLILREFELNDAIAMFELNKDPDVIKYTGDRAFQTIEDAKSFLKNYSDYKKNSMGRWPVITKDNNEFIGWCGLKLNEENLVDIGFRFFKQEWNKGYATESAKACLEYGFNELNLNKIIGRSDINNIGSIKVLEKINMKFWKYGEFKGVENSVYYSIDKNQYKHYSF